MKIVAFGHRKLVGKDTAAKFLVSHVSTTRKGLSIKVAGFADKLKSVCCDLYRWSGLMPGEFYEQPENAHLKGVKLPLIGMSPREIWIKFANSIRDWRMDTWYQYLLSTVKCDLLVVKDMRFPNEADGILQRGGHVYRITRAAAPIEDDGADDQLIGYDRWTGTIENDGTLRDLHEKVVEVAERIFR